MIIHEITISQSSDVGDAAAEALLIRLKKVTDVITDAITEVKFDEGDSAANANLNVNQTSQKIASAEVLRSEVRNIALPFTYLPTPEMRPVISIDDSFIVDLAIAPNDSITISGTLVFEEIGA